MHSNTEDACRERSNFDWGWIKVPVDRATADIAKVDYNHAASCRLVNHQLAIVVIAHSLWIFLEPHLVVVANAIQKARVNGYSFYTRRAADGNQGLYRRDTTVRNLSSYPPTFTNCLAVTTIRPFTPRGITPLIMCVKRNCLESGRSIKAWKRSQQTYCR